MTMLASQITSLMVVYSIVYSGVNQRKHQSSASLAFVREIHRGPVNFPHKWPVTRKMFPFDDVIMWYCVSGLVCCTIVQSCTCQINYFQVQVYKFKSNHSRRRWFKRPSHSLWRRCNVPWVQSTTRGCWFRLRLLTKQVLSSFLAQSSSDSLKHSYRAPLGLSVLTTMQYGFVCH